MSEPMTLESVRECVESVLAADRHDRDPESAHVDQDNLYEEVLAAVALGHPDAAAMARECLRVAESLGTRWYA